MFNKKYNLIFLKEREEKIKPGYVFENTKDLENLLNYVYDGLSVPYHWNIIEQKNLNIMFTN